MDPAAIKVLHWVLEARQAGESEVLSLPGADLRGATLLRADLVGAELSGAALEHATLAGAKLGNAKLDTALLAHVDLDGADLTGADLRGADLTAARLEGASLADADLRGACVVQVVGEPASLAGARIDHPFCERSGLADEEIIQLWQAGAVIDDLAGFSPVVQRACSSKAPEVLSDAGPTTRKLSGLEREARRQRTSEDAEVPPTSRLAVELARLAAAESEPESADAPPLSKRSLELVAPTLTSEMIAAPTWASGDTVLGATLGDLIGQGGAARVWQAEDGDGNPVAVKIFDATRAAVGLALPAYRRGVQVMNRLTGHADGLPAGIAGLRCVSLNKLGLVMPLAVHGSAVDLPALQWPVTRIVEFFRKVCEAVGAAHAVGVLHRCLKPSNILLDGDLDPLITDFDMADLPTLAAESVSAGGHRPYAAPEELLALGTQSPTADIFSLGRLLHFMLTGSDPVEAPEEIPKLAALDGQPEGLVRIIRKCTTRAPELRYQWVSELLDDLDQYEDRQVGIGGGPFQASFLPQHVSGLLHQTLWLEGKSRRSMGKPGPADAARTRHLERGIGWGGSVVALAVLAVVLVAPQLGPVVRVGLQIVSALAAAAMTLWVPPLGTRPVLWRALLAAVVAAGVFVLDLPDLLQH